MSVTLLRRAVKDPFPGLSHWAGMFLSIAGVAVLVSFAWGRAWQLVGCAIYGASLVLLYLASALAHTLRCSPRLDDFLTRLDCMAIYLLIAGTYTPLCLVTLRGPWGWGMLIAEWTMAAAGIVIVASKWFDSRWPRTLLYLFMAWVVALAATVPILRVLPVPALEWLLAGGVIYSIGAVVFALDRPDLWPGRFVAHDLWHVLVILGSACHFVVIARFVAAA
ncbi:MAG TPA: hemolysin III family protein [Tepidisphaeraceae bacterium]|jgi:hemolysin III|nr:hemolysin III family protein [Tepidisphaeraceae bacterium]